MSVRIVDLDPVRARRRHDEELAEGFVRHTLACEECHPWRCSECGRLVRRLSMIGAWVHDDPAEGTDCANARGDRLWHATR